MYLNIIQIGLFVKRRIFSIFKLKINILYIFQPQLSFELLLNIPAVVFVLHHERVLRHLSRDVILRYEKPCNFIYLLN
jgi:hypothetical protein